MIDGKIIYIYTYHGLSMKKSPSRGFFKLLKKSVFEMKTFIYLISLMLLKQDWFSILDKVSLKHIYSSYLYSLGQGFICN